MIVLRRQGERFAEDSFEGPRGVGHVSAVCLAQLMIAANGTGVLAVTVLSLRRPLPHHPNRYQFQKYSAITSGFASGVFGIGGLQVLEFCAGFLAFLALEMVSTWQSSWGPGHDYNAPMKEACWFHYCYRSAIRRQAFGASSGYRTRLSMGRTLDLEGCIRKR
ncbi:hypothetical protein FA13DRAFT_573265 [Coprinellus micaceus]|jgi:hypothetical protein|uniref:Uncharacterized protein n=1 Tax=Coprinellus micaceus TaxID=71717 RepID=A0A4Y7T7L1_COPMI|nr:hypothetical protein FA13DRAFT_573265 [Coprinellus micaceus]